MGGKDSVEKKRARGQKQWAFWVPGDIDAEARDVAAERGLPLRAWILEAVERAIDDYKNSKE